jgi:type IV pilus assembly protein PilP
LNIRSWATALQRRTALTPLMALVLLIGCAEIDTAAQKDLQGWMQNERIKHTSKALTPAEAADLKTHREHQASIYTPRQGVQPFSAERLLQTVPVDTPQLTQTKQLTPAPNQTRRPLDVLPLADMRLVGSLRRGSEALAMLRVQGLFYTVRVGDKIGQDQGRVSAITQSGLLVRESALSAVGRPSERIVSLALVQEP